ncbi:endopeptidase La [SCandidatus Aminicenantes bacterium Aminicenantia_JdfR_composite]|jgi:ATP-dependent Lon protease|nr:endopeptidase La [SCandidatus Aminicenantes bacterium Aminicenantia_JdfR_composite]MCP2597049.1 endopeptidase La [Candidatus Aminicenantes bacterium AC-335-G13]MCP2598003.1 endopeptidase La [Candidatus Aminicenantes bacterium AC-335-L06]MCP2605655.1 endopeptidase La [Candidatus Aminicenantes bacterium AC-335-O07]MCP2606170.1 endopeptidase La [Candidatus Aminicenantes bacterium AC-708-I09]
MYGSNYEKSEIIKSYPLIPLRDLVIFPSTLVPFIIGRNSSIQALEKAMEKDRMIFLSAQMDPTLDIPKPKDIYTVGIIAKVVQTVRTADSNIKVVVEGRKRARILEFLSVYPFYEVLTKEVLKINVSPEEVKDILQQVLGLFEEYVKISRNVNFESIIPALRDNTPERIADIIASHLYLPLEEKQNLLETVNPGERLRRLAFLLENELIRIRVEGKGKKKVSPPGQDIKQKVFGRGFGMRRDDQYSEIEELRQKIEATPMPPDAKEKAFKELERLESMPPMSAEATVSRNYLDWLLAVPWQKKSREKRDLKLAEKILNEDHYGLEKVKERILEYLAIRQLVKKPKGAILCFVGPPGVGKSSLARSIARATGRKFVRLSLGGVRDEAEIRGHRRTYIGAYPGRIIQMIKKAGTKNPVFLLDEVDKMSMDFRGDPAAALLEVLDPEQNNTFLDHYLDTEFDLSQVLFITTANVLQPIPKALVDRMEVIRIPGYTEDEKLQIGKHFLVKKQMKAHGLTEKNLKFTDEAILEIIRNYTREAGVRNLEREISSICRKVARKVVVHGKDFSEVITKEKVEEYLGVPKFRRQERERKSEVGIAYGLAWTEFGGELLTFEATMVQGKGNLTLTGQLGEIMQESAQTAFSYVRSKLFELGIAKNLHKNYDIHIHVPEGAVPKEGPSAGITIATAVISLLTGIPVNKDVAMTGEITLRGKVLPVGGIKEKLIAAHRAEVKEVLIPIDNKPDLKDIPAKIKEKIKIHLVENMDEVFERALTKPLPKEDKQKDLSQDISKLSFTN